MLPEHSATYVAGERPQATDGRRAFLSNHDGSLFNDSPPRGMGAVDDTVVDCGHRCPILWGCFCRYSIKHIAATATIAAITGETSEVINFHISSEDSRKRNIVQIKTYYCIYRMG